MRINSVFNVFLIAFLLPMSASIANAADSEIKAYYFPQSSKCTVLVDFKKNAELVASFKKDNLKAASLISKMTKEFEVSSEPKCKSAPTITLVATVIPSSDNYGRPDFSNRENVLQVEGAPQKLISRFAGASNVDLNELRRDFALKVF